MFDFTSKNVLIVGGTRGIGYATSMAFAKAGANVIPVSLDPQQVRDTTRELETMGKDTLEIICDATDLQSVQDMFNTLVSYWDGIDILVNCQGIHHKVPSEAVSDEQFMTLLDVNLTSVFRVCREAFPLLKMKQGNIINIASMGAFMGLKHAAAYSASKGAVAQLTKTLAVDWAEYGIRANAVAPGWIVTPLSEDALSQPEYRDPIRKRIPLSRFGDPKDVAHAILYLASDYASYVTGTVMVVDGGVLASV